MVHFKTATGRNEEWLTIINVWFRPVPTDDHTGIWSTQVNSKLVAWRLLFAYWLLTTFMITSSIFIDSDLTLGAQSLRNCCLNILNIHSLPRGQPLHDSTSQGIPRARRCSTAFRWFWRRARAPKDCWSVSTSLSAAREAMDHGQLQSMFGNWLWDWERPSILYRYTHIITYKYIAYFNILYVCVMWMTQCKHIDTMQTY